MDPLQTIALSTHRHVLVAQGQGSKTQGQFKISFTLHLKLITHIIFCLRHEMKYFVQIWSDTYENVHYFSLPHLTEQSYLKSHLINKENYNGSLNFLNLSKAFH